MQQCDDVETIYQSVLKTSLEKREEKKERPGSSSVFILKVVTVLCLFVTEEIPITVSRQAPAFRELGQALITIVPNS